MERKNLLDQQIANTSAQISNVEAQIFKYASLISEKEQELAEAEEQEAAQYELFCQRVRAMEKRGHRVLLVCSLQRGELYGPALQGGFHQ